MKQDSSVLQIGRHEEGGKRELEEEFMAAMLAASHVNNCRWRPGRSKREALIF